MDTLRLWIKGATEKDIKNVAPLFAKVENETGEILSHTGNYKNMKTQICKNGISITGSLTKFYLGDNVQTLSRQQIKEAIELLSDSFNLDILKAKVTRLDVGFNLIIENRVREYLSLLGLCANLIRSENISKDELTVYYRSYAKRANRSKELCFYDKVMEAKLPISDNLLRYELRFLKRLPQQLGVPEILGKTLLNDNFYTHLVSLWAENYFDIEKKKFIKLENMDNITKPNEAFNALVALLYSQADPALIEAFLATLKEDKAFADPKYYSRLNKKIRKINSNISLVETNELISELDTKIKVMQESVL